MLVFSAFVPHSPLLLESINKEKIDAVLDTLNAIEELERELYASNPDTIVLFSKHPNVYEDSFSIDLMDPYHFNLREFGDLGFDKIMHPDFLLIDRIQRNLRWEHDVPLSLNTDDALDYGAAVPIALLTKNLKNVLLVPVTYSGLGAKDHYNFGQFLKDLIIDSDKRIAVIAAGDMSHSLTSDSPAKFHEDGKKFDDKIMEIIAQKNTAGLISMNENFVENAKETCFKPLTMLFGILDRISVKPEILSYESPFGVGYMVVNFVIR
ncbi:MEMO1 family protein [Patescibacteria group bacterium]|nr:MEMO1 family protein [Patescibacteria group bacterium]